MNRSLSGADPQTPFVLGTSRAQLALHRIEGSLQGRSLNPKTTGRACSKRLILEACSETVRIQREHREARSRLITESPALFLNASGERLSTQGMANVIAQFRRDAGIERHVTPHMLRHTVATLLLRNGVDIRVVQEFLGHASIATTQRYTHIAKEHLIGVLRKHHPSLGLRAKV